MFQAGQTNKPIPVPRAKKIRKITPPKRHSLYTTTPMTENDEVFFWSKNQLLDNFFYNFSYVENL